MGRIPRTDADWLELIREAASDSGRVRLTRHARERMQKRQISMREVLNVVRRGVFDEAPAPAINPAGHWNARLVDRSGIGVAIGLDPAGDPVVLDIITVMRGR